MSTAGADVAHRVIAWQSSAGRDLPWRHTRDPWAILVAEVMSHQTQVARIIGPYENLLARFPHPAACAQAPLAEVLRAWSGLGYNRRARYLHQCARQIVERHGGAVPDDLEALLALPGIGPYSARAVLAFAFERDVAVVDANVGRVLARAVAGQPLSPKVAQALADSLVPAGAGWAYNQAMIDLGAQCCTARTPHCDRCPLQTQCRWRGCGPDPARRSAGVTRAQSTFEGSDRQGRGRLIAALTNGEVERAQLAAVCGWADDQSRAERILEALVSEGMVTVDEKRSVLTLGQ